MTQDNTQLNQPAEAEQASGNAAPSGVGSESGLPARAAPAPVTSSASSTEPCDNALNTNALNKELRWLNRALQALSACNQALAQAGNEQELLDQICDIIVRVGGYRMAGIAYALHDPEKTVRPVAHAGHGSGYFEKIPLNWSDTPTGHGPAGTAIRENRICVTGDTANDPRFALWRERALQRGYASVVALPLRAGGAPFGVLAIYSEQVGSFEGTELDLLTEVANNLAYGITAIRSHEEGKRANAALKEAERRYRQLVEQVPAISYIAEPGESGRFHYISPQVEHILGFTPEEWMADDHTWFNVLHPEDAAKTIAAEHRRVGELYRVEYRTRAKNGREVWLRDDAVFVTDIETGRLLMRGLMVDVTERKRADEALRRSEENYRMFVAQSSEGIFRHDLDAPVSIDLPEDELIRRILHDSSMAECNQAMANMYGLSSPAELLGKRLTELLAAGDPQNAELTREYIRGGFRVLERESHEVDVHGNPKVFLNSMFGIVENRKLWHTWGIQRDITERLKAEDARRKAEDARRESEERYRVFVAQSSEGIYRTEHDPPVPVNLPLERQLELSLQTGYVAECNDAMARMYGFLDARALMGKKLSEFLIADDPVTIAFMTEFIQSGYRIEDRESHEKDAHGRVKVFRNTMMGIVDKGCLVRTWGIQRDVTERMHLEEQLRNAQQLEAIGRLAGGVAHDFNNILSIIMGHGELLLTAIGGDEGARNGLEQIQRAADRAASLTQQLLAFSRKQVLQPKILDLNEAVADVQKMLSRVIGEDIELIAQLHPSLVPVKADPGQVEQVLMNLAVNARDAMPHGGRLTMETSNVELDAAAARDLELVPGRYVMLRVLDSGHGMDGGTLSHVFEPFFTTKPMGKGTGLGLSTVWGIVKQSGGSIQVASEVGHGTTFRIYLPVAEGVTRKRQEPIAAETVGRGTETILLAEDEPDLRELARIFLEGYGYKVLEAASAEQAIEVASSFPGTIDLLLTDVIMPGMSGRQLAENLLSTSPQTRIVYMTGYTDDMVVQHKVLEPGVKLLQKPFGRVELALKVRSTLDGK